MTMRTRAPLVQSRRSDQFHKFLKPGALARIRDSRITARSHRIDSLAQISLRSSSPPPSSPSRSTDGVNQVNVADCSPCFSVRSFGPRCPQRKKLVAAKYALFVSPAAPNNTVLNSQDLIADSVNNEAVAAAN